MNWSLFLLNQLTEDAVAAQEGERSFSYIWLSILITLVAWMEPEDSQSMVVEAVKVCKGTWYQNLWWVEESNRQAYCMINFRVYWEALQEAVVKVPWLSDATMIKYYRIIQQNRHPKFIKIYG